MLSNKIRDFFDKLKNRRNMRKLETTKKKAKSLENSGEPLRDRVKFNGVEATHSYPKGMVWRKTGRSGFYHGDEYVAYYCNKEYRRWGTPPVILNSKGVTCPINECYKIKTDKDERGL